MATKSQPKYPYVVLASDPASNDFDGSVAPFETKPPALKHATSRTLETGKTHYVFELTEVVGRKTIAEVIWENSVTRAEKVTR